MPKNINCITIRHKCVFGPTQTHFSVAIRWGLKWSPRRAQNVFRPKNIDCITIRHKCVLGPTQTRFSVAIRWGLKWSPRRAENVFMPKNINCITIIITLEGIERKKLKRMITKRSEECFFNVVGTNTSMAPWFWLAAYIVRLFDSHFSWVYFSNEWQSDSYCCFMSFSQW